MNYATAQYQTPAGLETVRENFLGGREDPEAQEAAAQHLCKNLRVGKIVECREIVTAAIAAKPVLEKVFAGYTQQELQDVFNLVKNRTHWKRRINKTLVLTGEQQRLVSAAISYFCGSPSEFQQLPNGKVRVTAPGYYACIGA